MIAHDYKHRAIRESNHADRDIARGAGLMFLAFVLALMFVGAI